MFTPNFNLIEELRWRGLLHDSIPGTEELLQKEMVTAYVGFDPTADSLHIGNMVPIMLLIFLQKAGHKPIALLGGATGMVGDPSGKNAERQLLDEATLQKNLDGQKQQLMQFLDFENGENKAEMVNNYDWFKQFGFLEFIRDVGKHITVSYMMSKDSVKNRMENAGISFTEFTYQLVQGYDFLHLYENNNCKLQMGGSDQWGNITTGTELIRRKANGDAFAITAPLITKSDGTKFGKSEGGNIWLDKNKTSVYNFYQFWINISDEDAEKFIKIYSLKTKNEIENIIQEHKGNEHTRGLQKALAQEITARVHGEQELQNALNATNIILGNASKTDLINLDQKSFENAIEGTEKFVLNAEEILGKNILDVVAVLTPIFSSKGEAKKMIVGNGFSINHEKNTNAEYIISKTDIVFSQYILFKKGKNKIYTIQLV